MTALKEFRCEVCGIVTSNPIHWFVIRCGDSELTVHRWNAEAADALEPVITAVKPTPKYTSAVGLIGLRTAEAKFQVERARLGFGCENSDALYRNYASKCLVSKLTLFDGTA